MLLSLEDISLWEDVAVSLLSLASLLVDWVPVWCKCSSGVSPSLWVTSSLELVPVPVLENISLWEGVLVWKVTIFSTIFSVIVLFISPWEGVSVWKWAMLLVVVLSLLWAWNWPNGTVGRVSSDWWLSLGLTTDRSPPRSWFKSLSALDCDNYWDQQVRVFRFDGPFGRVWPGPPCWYGLDTAYRISCKPGLLPQLDGTLQWIQCLCNIRVIGSISNSSDYKLWYIVIWKIFHFGRVLFVLVLKGNILLVIVRIFHFRRVFPSGKPVFCYFTLGGCWGSGRQSAWNYWYIVTCSSSVMYPRLSGCFSFSQCQWYQLQCQFAIHSSLKGNRLPHLSPVLAESVRLALSWLLVYLACNAIKDWQTTVKSTGLAFLVTRLLPWSILDGNGRPSPSGCALKLVRASWWLLPELLAFSMSLFMVWICLSMKPLLCE